MAVCSAQTITGFVFEEEKSEKHIPLQGALVYWANSDSSAVVTDTLGYFSIEALPSNQILVVNYENTLFDSLVISGTNEVKFILKSTTELKEVVITNFQDSKMLNLETVQNMQTMNSGELLKAACCNLAESFETNPSVDVSYSDALTGAKSIQLLGLSNKYTLYNTENLPSIRGLNTSNGLQYIPGTWLQSIQITKGIGSAAVSSEGIGGEINSELKKPDSKEKLLFNFYINNMLRSEYNFNHQLKLSDKWSQLSMYHLSNQAILMDVNSDGFANIPKGSLGTMLHRWKYQHKSWIAQFGFQVMNDQKKGGTLDNSISDSAKYQILLRTKRLETFAKIGYVFPQKKYKSIGILAKSYVHRQQDRYGSTLYTGNEDFLYIAGIYQSIIKNTAHKFRIGLSSQLNRYLETVFFKNYNRTVVQTGGFTEYTYTKHRFSSVVSVRLDYYNLYGWVVSPRIHTKYDLGKNTVWRISGGRGVHEVNIFAENSKYFMSNRIWQLKTVNSKYAYGLPLEKAWNWGSNLAHEWKYPQKKGSVNVDFYSTMFTHQVVADMYSEPYKLSFYSIDYYTFTHNAQIEVNQQFKNLELRFAYRYVNAQTLYNGIKKELPFIAKHRGFVNIAYQSKNRKWKLDYTINYMGTKKVPLLITNDGNVTKEGFSKNYITQNAQITKVFNKKSELYIGVENIGNVIQKTLIISPNNPLNSDFDATMVWGPTIGRMVYLGYRYIIK